MRETLGLLGRKVGMTRIFTDEGESVPVTVLDVSNNRVAQVRTTDVTGSIALPAGTEMVMPGDNIQMEVALIAPIAMEQGLRFAVREGGKTVGAGVVAKIIE